MIVNSMVEIETPTKKEIVELLFSGRLYYKITEQSEPIKAERHLLEWLQEMINDKVRFYERKSHHWTELLPERGFWCICWQNSSRDLGQAFEFITDFDGERYIGKYGKWDGAYPINENDVSKLSMIRGISE